MTTYYALKVANDIKIVIPWKDKEEKTDYTFKAICPKQNMMIVNDTAELHTVTTISPYITNPRFSIQIWGMEE